MPLTDEQLATARARNDEYAYGLSVTADITLAMLLDEIDRLRVLEESNVTLLNMAEALCARFVEKCDVGLARSRETYRQCQEFLAALAQYREGAAVTDAHDARVQAAQSYAIGAWQALLIAHNVAGTCRCDACTSAKRVQAIFNGEESV